MTETLVKVSRPWPVRRNPIYAIATVQKIARNFVGLTLGGTANMELIRLIPFNQTYTESLISL